MQTAPSTRQQIESLLDQLSPQQLERVRAFIQAMRGRPAGISAEELIEFFHSFPPFSAEEQEEMTRIL